MIAGRNMHADDESATWPIDDRKGANDTGQKARHNPPYRYMGCLWEVLYGDATYRHSASALHYNSPSSAAPQGSNSATDNAGSTNLVLAPVADAIGLFDRSLISCLIIVFARFLEQ